MQAARQEEWVRCFLQQIPVECLSGPACHAALVCVIEEDIGSVFLLDISGVLDRDRFDDRKCDPLAQLFYISVILIAVELHDLDRPAFHDGDDVFDRFVDEDADCRNGIIKAALIFSACSNEIWRLLGAKMKPAKSGRSSFSISASSTRFRPQIFTLTISRFPAGGPACLFCPARPSSFRRSGWHRRCPLPIR